MRRVYASAGDQPGGFPVGRVLGRALWHLMWPDRPTMVGVCGRPLDKEEGERGVVCKACVKAVMPSDTQED